jgi:hypothetical protein
MISLHMLALWECAARMTGAKETGSSAENEPRFEGPRRRGNAMEKMNCQRELMFRPDQERSFRRAV